MVLVLSFAFALGLEIFNSICATCIDEFFKLVKHKIINIKKYKFLIYKFYGAVAGHKDYMRWCILQNNFNKENVSKIALNFQCIIHIYVLFNLIIGFIFVDLYAFNSIPTIYWYVGIIPSIIILICMPIVIVTLFNILLDKDIAKRFPKDSN